MPNPDLLLYTVHYACWTVFGITLLVLRFKYGRDKAPAKAPVVKEAHTARHSRALVAFHGVAFFVMYSGMAIAVFGRRVPIWFDGQRVVGTVVIALGWILGMSAMFYFRSWRFRATLDQGHQLATGGPFRLVRHPIYMALTMLALGTAIWAPTPILWIAFLLMAIGSDLRGRAEERILEDAFGDRYRDYCRRTHRFVPYVY